MLDLVYNLRGLFQPDNVNDIFTYMPEYKNNEFLLIGLILFAIGLVVFAFLLLWKARNRSFLVRRFFEIWKEEGILTALKGVFIKFKIFFFWKLRKWLSPPNLFKDRYYFEDNSEVVMYLFNRDHLLTRINYQPQRILDPADLSTRVIQVSLIVTVKNEANNVVNWWQSVINQTRLPDEIVITDAGSTDETLPLLEKFAKESNIPLQIIKEPGVNIARGRNVAISNARYNVIATTDFGCRLRPDWLEKLIIPFELEKETQVVAGMYVGIDARGREVERSGWWSIKSIKNPKEFLPSARSSAFTKKIWEEIGGYPEWLSLTGEDTYFALELKKYASAWAFVPEAIAEWQAPATMLTYWKKLFNWSKGDGESGVNGSGYWKLTLHVLISVLLGTIFLLTLSMLIFVKPLVGLWRGLFIGILILIFILIAAKLKATGFRLLDEFGAKVAKILGFVSGTENRKNIDPDRQATVKGTIFILSGVPIDDTGGGARCTQLALELLRQKYAVVFINKFPKYETVDLNLSINDANLISYPISEFEWDIFTKDHGWVLQTPMIGALVEMPIEEFVPIIHKIRKKSGVVAYDLLDEWNTTLGGTWYTEEVEREIINSSQLLLATAPALVNRLANISNREVFLVPNAVNVRLFSHKRYYKKPEDFPKAPWTVIYIGALWGDWFDWELLTRLAEKHPEAAIIVIGDYKGQSLETPSNLHFLGLKKQLDLPVYLAHADVAIIPWKVNEITQATSPLKIYEYLAMGKPVVAPEIDPLQGIPGVFLAKDKQEFLDLVKATKDSPLPHQEISDFINAHNWTARVEYLLNLLRGFNQNQG